MNAELDGFLSLAESFAKAGESIEALACRHSCGTSAMRYDVFRSQGMFIGSGVIEASCKTVVGKRCKQSGMFWNESGVENILTLRVARQNGTYDAIWTDESLRKIRNAARWNYFVLHPCLKGFTF